MSENPTPNPTSDPVSGPSAGEPQVSKAAALKAQVETQMGKLKGVQDSASQVVKGPLQFWLQVFRSTRSEDAETRHMAWLFLVAQIGIIGVIVYAVILFGESHKQALKIQQELQAENLTRLVEKQKRISEVKQTTLRIGTFGVALTDIPGSKRLPGVVDMAELEITVQCDVRETCAYLEENMVRTKDVITQALGPQDREDLLSSDGKERLKNTISQRVNEWLPHGEIRKIFFSRVLID